ncbi:hypothetical protein AB4K20DRAFT_1870452 [Rhizopus microsporus]|uniref:Uncharacterized protein n=1 Tax=Rhizopus microsporus TaxID=58291 RepID=A0A1X0SCH7_RHIZD|nr:hypothetical protein BCV71DRAFT_273087 [Rhizopus microsporus]
MNYKDINYVTYLSNRFQKKTQDEMRQSKRSKTKEYEQETPITHISTERVIYEGLEGSLGLNLILHDYNSNYQKAKAFLLVNNNSNLKNTITSIVKFITFNDTEENIKKIYLFILKLHLRKPFSFHQDRMELYSEGDYVVKFWTNVFESFFGSNDHFLFFYIAFDIAYCNSCLGATSKPKLAKKKWLEHEIGHANNDYEK